MDVQNDIVYVGGMDHLEDGWDEGIGAHRRGVNIGIVSRTHGFKRFCCEFCQTVFVYSGCLEVQFAHAYDLRRNKKWACGRNFNYCSFENPHGCLASPLWP